MNCKLSKNSKAFGIVEALIASSIIAMILFALVAVGRNSIRGVEEAEKRSQAILLAQDAIEQVRQIRDSNWISSTGEDWNSLVWNGDNLVKVTPDDYIIEYKKFAADGLKKIMRYGLVETTDNGLLVNLGGTGEVGNRIGGNDFYQLITIDTSNISNLIPVSGDDVDPKPDINAIKVTAKISWDDNKSLEISEVLTNWRPAY